MTSHDPNIGPKAVPSAAVAAATLAVTMVAEPTGSTALRGSQVTGPNDGFGGVGSGSTLETMTQFGPALVLIATNAFSVLKSSCSHRRTVDTSKRAAEDNPTADADVSPVIQDEEVLSSQSLLHQEQQQPVEPTDLTNDGPLTQPTRRALAINP